VPHLLWHVALVFPVSSEEPPHLVASYDTRGDVEDLHCILTRIHTGNLSNEIYLQVLCNIQNTQP
jgi:hypothetical protein